MANENESSQNSENDTSSVSQSSSDNEMPGEVLEIQLHREGIDTDTIIKKFV